MKFVVINIYNGLKLNLIFYFRNLSRDFLLLFLPSIKKTNLDKILPKTGYQKLL